MFNHQSNLRQKRNQFHNQIRRQQRQSIMKAMRQKINLQIRQIQLGQITQQSNLPFEQLIKNLKLKKNQSLTLRQMTQILNSPNCNTVFEISKIFSTITHCYLIENLNQRRYLQETLSLLCTIISKKQSKYADILLQKGFLEILLQLLEESKQLALLITNIIANLCIQSEGYCQIILENYKHHIFIKIFNNISENFLQNRCNQQSIKVLGMILWFLSVLVSTKQSCLDFQKQYDEIINFSLILLERQIFQSESFIIIYELALKNPQKVENMIHPIINQLLISQTGQNQYLQNLLILISRLSPGNFRYDLIFNLIKVVKYELINHIVIILSKISEKSSDCLIKQSQWQQFLIRTDHQKPQFKTIITIARRLNINYSCMWRFISTYLQDIYDNSTISQILVYLRRTTINLIEQQNNQQSSNLSKIEFLQILNKYRIINSLQRLSLKQNYQLSAKAEELLQMLNKMQKDVKDRYNIDIQ